MRLRALVLLPCLLFLGGNCLADVSYDDDNYDPDDGANDISGYFPDDFLWGVATASYQVEGGWNESLKAPSIWDTMSHLRPCTIAYCENGDVACDSYHLWREDIRIMQEIGVNTYRFSISWPRLFYNGTPGQIDYQGYLYYSNLIDGLLAVNITPMVTLYHWDLPQYLQDEGGWMNERIQDWFYYFADFCFYAFGDRVKMWYTFNEPESFIINGYNGFFSPVLPSCPDCPYVANKNLLLAHANAYHVYDKVYRQQQGGQVGMVIGIEDARPKDNQSQNIMASGRQMDWLAGVYLEPLLGSGNWPQTMIDIVAERSAMMNLTESRLPRLSIAEQQHIRGTLDMFGVNIYTASLTEYQETDLQPRYYNDIMAHTFKDPRWPSSDSDWLKLVPSAVPNVLKYIANTYNSHIPLYITESGWSNAPDAPLEDGPRIRFLNDYIRMALGAYQDGINLKGFVTWALMDNFEWRAGYEQRFGLYYVNFTDDDRPRIPKKSSEFYATIIKNNGFPPNQTTTTHTQTSSMTTTSTPGTTTTTTGITTTSTGSTTTNTGSTTTRTGSTTTNTGSTTTNTGSTTTTSTGSTTTNTGSTTTNTGSTTTTSTGSTTTNTGSTTTNTGSTTTNTGSTTTNTGSTTTSTGSTTTNTGSTTTSTGSTTTTSTGSTTTNTGSTTTNTMSSSSTSAPVTPSTTTTATMSTTTTVPLNCTCPPSEYTDPSGMIMSPNYPEDYCNFITCYYKITVPSNSIVQLRMIGLLEPYDVHWPSGDQVTIGETSCTSVVGLPLRNSFDRVFYSLTNEMKLTFQANGTGTAMGFVGSYVAIPNIYNLTRNQVQMRGAETRIIPPEVAIRSQSIRPEFNMTLANPFISQAPDSLGEDIEHNCDCGTRYYAGPWGVIQLPSTLTPNTNYCNNMQCWWQITVEPGMVVQVRIIGHTEPNDNIAVFDTACRFYNAPLIGGYDIDHVLQSDTNEMGLAFNSDANNETNIGFLIYYEAVLNVPAPAMPLPIVAVAHDCDCPPQEYGGGIGIIKSSNEPYNYCNNQSCTYNIKTWPGAVVRLYIRGETYYGFDFVRIYNTTEGTKVLSGYFYTYFYSTSNEMMVKFTSDITATKYGFYAFYQPCYPQPDGTYQCHLGDDLARQFLDRSIGSVDVI